MNIKIAYSQSAESSEVQVVRRVRLATVLASRALFATQDRAAHRWRSNASPILIESSLWATWRRAQRGYVDDDILVDVTVVVGVDTKA